jgi:hypothetical protein
VRAALALCAALAGGCVSVSEGVSRPEDVGGDAVVLVGRIRIVPPIRPDEQRYRMGVDVFNTRRHFVGRAILYMSDRPGYQERTPVVLNPALEELFFLELPRAQRFVAKGSVMMELVSRGRSGPEQVELLFPPLALDVREGDRALYIGTLRLHRDEFHEVTKVEVLDEYREAALEFREKFGGGLPPRKALLRTKE